MDATDRVRPMIDVSFTKKHQDFALDVAFAAPDTGITAIFGRNGAGKTSVLSAIAGALLPDDGHIAVGDTVFFDSRSGTNLTVERRRIGYVFQDSRLFPHMNVSANLMFGFKRFRGEAQISPDTVISLLGLEELLSRRPVTLSGGERQRVAIGRALLAQPALLLMDEPLASLDPPRKAELLPYIERVRDDFGLPVMLISHDFDEVMRLADHLVLMDSGRVASSGPLQDLASDPALATLIGRFEAGSVIDTAIAAHDDDVGMSTLAFEGGAIIAPRVASEIGTAIRVRVRARDVALSLSEPVDSSITNRLAGQITELVSREGTFVDVSVRVGTATFRSVVTAATVKRLALEIGKPVWVLFKAAALDSRSVGFTRRARPASAAKTAPPPPHSPAQAPR